MSIRVRSIYQVRGSKEPIRTCYFGNVTGYRPIRDHYFLIRSILGERRVLRRVPYVMLQFARASCLCNHNSIQARGDRNLATAIGRGPVAVLLYNFHGVSVEGYQSGVLSPKLVDQIRKYLSLIGG